MELINLGLHLLLLHGLLAVVHPNLENLSFYTDLRAKLMQFLFILSLDLPPQFLSKLHHLILLLL